jgi:hypothetical protein
MLCILFAQISCLFQRYKENIFKNNLLGIVYLGLYERLFQIPMLVIILLGYFPYATGYTDGIILLITTDLCKIYQITSLWALNV